MSQSPFQLLSRREIYQNGYIHVREDKVIRPGGGEGSFSVVTMKSGSSVLAMNRAREVYLVREYKYAVERTSLEVISGGIDPGESPRHAAERELKEEAGLRAGRLLEMGVLHPFTSIIHSPNYLFLALDVEETGEQHPDPGEVLQLVKMPLDEAVAALERGEIVHGASCVLLLRAQLRQQNGARD